MDRIVPHCRNVALARIAVEGRTVRYPGLHNRSHDRYV